MSDEKNIDGKFVDPTGYIEENINKAMEAIEAGFAWEDTPQGFDYWLGVVNDLDELLQLKKEANNG